MARKSKKVEPVVNDDDKIEVKDDELVIDPALLEEKDEIDPEKLIKAVEEEEEEAPEGTISTEDDETTTDEDEDDEESYNPMEDYMTDDR